LYNVDPHYEVNVNVDLYSASTQTASNRYRFGADLRLTSPQPDTSQHCETTDTG